MNIPAALCWPFSSGALHAGAGDAMSCSKRGLSPASSVNRELAEFVLQPRFPYAKQFLHIITQRVRKVFWFIW